MFLLLLTLLKSQSLLIFLQVSVDSLNDKVQEKEVELQAAVSFFQIFEEIQLIFNWCSLSRALAYKVITLAVYL